MTTTQYAIHNDTPWTVEDLATLERMTAAGESARRIGLAIGRTAAAVRTRRNIQRIAPRAATSRSRKHGAEYTRAEIRNVRVWIDECVPVKEQARRLNRTLAAVYALHTKLRNDGLAGYMYPQTCTVEGCENRHHSHFMCRRHYNAARRARSGAAA